MLPQSRFYANLECTLRVDGPNSGPSSLLIPEHLMSGFHALLSECDVRPGILLRILLRMYRVSYLEGEFPQMASVKRVYQAKGSNLTKITFRVENSVWLEFGQVASYLGVSRCFLFAVMIERAAWDLDEQDERVPTSALARYDLYRPEYLEFLEHWFPGKNQCKRKLSLHAREYAGVPHFIRYDIGRRKIG
jgi:hypothetical protein